MKVVVTKTWEELSVQGVNLFEIGQQDLLNFRHTKAKENFSLAAQAFQKAALKNQYKIDIHKVHESYYNAAISLFYGGNYQKAWEYLTLTNYHKIVPKDLSESYQELSSLIKARCKDGYWATMRNDYQQLKQINDYGGILDMVRNVPYVIPEHECKCVAIEACLKLGFVEVAESILKS